MNWKWFNKYDATKPTISFLHGFLENSEIWHPFITKISEEFNCLLFDFPLNNHSTISEKDLSFEIISTTFYNTLIKLNISKTHIIGHSMGGYFGCYIKNKYPEVIDKLILCNSNLNADTEDQKLKREKIIRILKSNFSAFCNICFIKYKGKSIKMNAIIDKKIENALKQSPQYLIAYQNIIKDRPDFEKVFNNYSDDFFFLFGEFDVDIPWKTMLPKLKKRYYIFPNEKHILPLNSIDKWSQKTLSILK